MERQEKAKQTGKAVKAAAKPQSKPTSKPTIDTKLTGVSVTRTGVRAAKAGTKAGVKKSTGPISIEQRRQLIAEAAYFRALSRGFEGGDPVADWLDAEHEVDQSLGKAAD